VHQPHAAPLTPRETCPAQVMGIAAAMALRTRAWERSTPPMAERAAAALERANNDSYTKMLDESLEL